MLRFVSALAILAATAKAAPVEPVHYSFVSQHPVHYEPAHHAIPEVHYPIHVLESHGYEPQYEHVVAELPQKYIVESHHDDYHGHHEAPEQSYVAHGNAGGYSALYGGEVQGHLYSTGGESGYAKKYNDYYAYPKYKFEYGVDDPHTGDHKKQWEYRDGDVVKGGYMLKEADGTTRVVEYTADDHNGFNAVVKNIGHAHHPAPHAHAPVSVNNAYGHLGNYAGAYATGDYYGKGATSYSKIWKQH
nr:adult-specific cuticular protein ACP-20-like [Aedes albopictus]